jgi:hypothetical protein
MAWFYDDADFNSGSIREIERIYCFLFDSFSESDWEILNAICNKLPNPQPSKSVPYWFGTEETGNYLWASVEPPGWQVAGTLREGDWLAWETTFHEQIQRSPLPRHEIKMQ